MSEFGGLWQHTHNQARTISDKNNLIIVVSQRTEEEENTHTHTQRERERERVRAKTTKTPLTENGGQPRFTKRHNVLTSRTPSTPPPTGEGLLRRVKAQYILVISKKHDSKLAPITRETVTEHPMSFDSPL